MGCIFLIEIVWRGVLVLHIRLLLMLFAFIGDMPLLFVRLIF